MWKKTNPLFPIWTNHPGCSKIIFWMNAFFLNFVVAESLKKKYDCDIYALIDITNRTKQFFIDQNLVNFKKTWYIFDNILIL